MGIELTCRSLRRRALQCQDWCELSLFITLLTILIGTSKWVVRTSRWQTFQAQNVKIILYTRLVSVWGRRTFRLNSSVCLTNNILKLGLNRFGSLRFLWFCCWPKELWNVIQTKFLALFNELFFQQQTIWPVIAIPCPFLYWIVEK